MQSTNKLSVPFQNKVTIRTNITDLVSGVTYTTNSDGTERVYYNIDTNNFPPADFIEGEDVDVFEWEEENRIDFVTEYKYYDIVTNTSGNFLDENTGIKVELDYVSRNLITAGNTLDFSNNALVFLTNELSNDYNISDSIFGIHTNVNTTTNELSYCISENNLLRSSIVTVNNSNVESSKLEIQGIRDESVTNDICYNLSVTTIDQSTTHNGSVQYLGNSANNINFKKLIIGYNLDVTINDVKIYQLNPYVIGTHDILILLERNISAEVSNYTRDIVDITEINDLNPSPLMEFGSTLYGSAYQDVAYGFRVEMRFKDNNNDINSSPFLFYMADNTTNNPSTNFTDSSNAFYTIKRNASGRIGKQYIINMPGLSYVDILTPIIAASNFETTYNTIIIDVSNNNVEITTSVNSDKITLGFLNNDQYTGLINNYVFNRIWVGYDLNLDVEMLKITTLI